MKPQIDVVRCYIEHPDYFQGADPDVFVGMGDTALSALDDALEFCASGGRDSEGKDLPDDLDWPSVSEQEQLLREAHCDVVAQAWRGAADRSGRR
jgi:hypothetical protein